MKWISLMLFTLAMGCGGNNDKSSSASPPPQREEPTPSTAKVYRATLKSVNTKVSPLASGIATIQIENDDISVHLSAANLENSVHMQHVHMASRCPTKTSDANSDGYIDAMEARTVTGPGIIPLDADLNSQEGGSGSFPSGRSYVYRETASFRAMMSDLRQRELDSDNSVVRLGPGANLNLSRRVIVIHGTDATAILPSTVASYNGVPAQDTIPVACGELNQISQ